MALDYKSYAKKLIGYYFLYSGAIIAAYFAFFTVIYRFIVVHGFKIIRSQNRPLPPSILNNPIFGNHSYIQIKNVKLHYVEQGEKNKPLMIFLHGFPDFWFGWREQIDYFSKNYWVVAVDMRGYGDSEKPTGLSSYHLKNLVGDVKNLIEALGRQKCILVAHDWGAIVGWHALLEYPNMFEKYVMISIPPPYATRLPLIQYIRSWYVFFFQLPFLPEFWLKLGDQDFLNSTQGSSSQEIKDAYKFTFGKPGAYTSALGYYRKALISAFDTHGKKLNEIKFPPGFVLYTDNDFTIDKNDFNDLDKFPNLKSEMIKNAGHFIHQLKSEETNKAISKFLDGATDALDGPSEKETNSYYDDISY